MRTDVQTKHLLNNVLTNLSTLSPPLQIISGLLFNDRYILSESCNVQSILEHFFLLQEYLKNVKRL